MIDDELIETVSLLRACVPKPNFKREREMRRLSKRKEKLANLIDTTNWENREIYCHDYGEKYVLREVRKKDSTVILVSSKPIAGATNSFLWRIQDVLANLRGNGVNSERRRFEMGQKIQDEGMIGIVAKVLRDDKKAIAEQMKNLDRRKIRKIKKQEKVQKVKKKKKKRKIKLNISGAVDKKRKSSFVKKDEVDRKRKRLFERKKNVYSSMYDSVVIHLNLHKTILQPTKPVKCETCGFLFNENPTKCPPVCICGRSLETPQRPNFSFVKCPFVMFGQAALDIAHRATLLLKQMRMGDRSKLLFPKLEKNVCCKRCGFPHHSLLPCVRVVFDLNFFEYHCIVCNSSLISSNITHEILAPNPGTSYESKQY